MQKNLGVILQADMSINKHILSIATSCFPPLRDFSRICPFISKTTDITLANTFVHSRLGFCNIDSFMAFRNISIHCLQKVQNTVASVVSC